MFLNRDDVTTFLKGFAMGAANVVPGVSGGTMALIFGIYERLINALKSFDTSALKMAGKFQATAFFAKTDLRFLISLGLGMVVSILTLAKILKIGFTHHPTLVWAFFFGLILASIPAIAKQVRQWTPACWAWLIIGAAAALSMAFLTPASENKSLFYLLLCGVAAMCSMIIPGLSGSFVLLLMGNYELVMLDAVNHLSAGEFGQALPVLIPVGIGAVVGLLVLSRLLSWLFKNFHGPAVAGITGFVVGSLAIIYPWKDKTERPIVLADGSIKRQIDGYENWHLPDLTNSQTWPAFGAIFIGAALIFFLDRIAKKKNPEPES